MFEDSVSSIPSIWASMNSWFTPTVLFVLLNVVIATIAFTSTQKHHQPNPKPHQNDVAAAQPHHLTRSPSVLQRLRSFTYPSQDPNSHFAPQLHTTEPQTQTQTQTHGYFDHVPDPNTHFAPEQKTEQTHGFFQVARFDPAEDSQSIDEVYSKLRDNRHVNRTNSDTKPSGGEMPERLAARLRKSASAKSAFSHFEEEEVVDVVEARRPATVREAAEGDEEVDSKADDFINRFKHQLKLQRLDSIIRYKDMISRGGGGGK